MRTLDLKLSVRQSQPMVTTSCQYLLMFLTSCQSLSMFLTSCQSLSMFLTSRFRSLKDAGSSASCETLNANLARPPTVRQHALVPMSAGFSTPSTFTMVSSRRPTASCVSLVPLRVWKRSLSTLWLYHLCQIISLVDCKRNQL